MDTPFLFKSSKDLVVNSKSNERLFDLFEDSLRPISLVKKVVLTGDRRFLIVTCNSNFLLIVDYKSMESIGTFRKMNGFISDVVFTEDNKMILASGMGLFTF